MEKPITPSEFDWESLPGKRITTFDRLRDALVDAALGRQLTWTEVCDALVVLESANHLADERWRAIVRSWPEAAA